MKRFIALLAVSLTLSGQALAHGAQPKHGGVVAHAADLSFELVTRDGKAVIYIDDHGRALPTRGAGGTLTVLQGRSKSETTLSPSGDNTLVSQAEIKLAKGSKAVASIALPDKQPIRVRFAVK